MFGWHHWLNGHEFKQALRNGEGQRSLACCSPWGCKMSDMTERLNNNLDSSWPFSWCAQRMLNKQGDSRQPCCIHFSILNQSVVPYRVLTLASWLTYRFLRRQVRWFGIRISLRAFYSLSWSTRSNALFNVVDETEIDVFLKFRCFLYNPANLAIWSLVLPFLNPAWTSGNSWFAWYWSLACKILSMTLLAWEMSAVVWWLAHSLVLPFWELGWRLPFPVMWPLLGLPDLLT